MESPTLSVVIPTFNRRAILALTLPTVLAQDFPAEQREIVVVVDGSTDGTVELLSEPALAGVWVIEQPNRGQAGARNAGLRAARGRLVLFLDDDMQCEPNLLSGHVAAHANAARLIVEGASELSPDSTPGLVAEWRHQWVSRHFEQIRSRRDERWPWQAIRFANTSAPRSLLLDCGGFDERFRFAHEDLEFGLRLAGREAQYAYRPDLAARHVYRKSAKDVMGREALWYGRGLHLLCQIHPDYRRYSALAILRRGPWWKAYLRELAARFPVSPDLLLAPSFAVAAKFDRMPLARRAARRLLDYRADIGFFRGAREAAGSWQGLRREFGVRLPVLMYHHVGPLRCGTSRALTVSPLDFAAQMGWLYGHGYTPIRVTDWIAWCDEGKPLPEKPILISFDDGYADLARYALPTLHRYRFPAIVFVVTSLIGMTNQWDERTGWGTLRLMTTEQIREAVDQGIEFGAHSRTHPDLTAVSSEQLEHEISGSAAELERVCGTRPTAFAYPYGSYDERVRETASRAFRVSFTADEALNSLATDRFLLNRLAVLRQYGLLGFGFTLSMGFHPIGRLRELVRLRSRLRAAARRATDLWGSARRQLHAGR